MSRKKLWGTMLSLAVAVVTIVAFGSMTVFADTTIVASGDCGAQGSNVTWSLDSDGKLTIAGEGSIADYKQASDTPWYGNKDNIKSINIGDGVTSIGNYAFANCENLTSINLNGVTSIGAFAFTGCTTLPTVNLNSVTVGESAFSSCGLQYVSISGSMKRIEAGTFAKCQSLNHVNFPSDLEYIGNGAFYNCGFRSFTQYDFPKSLKTIGDRAFADCSSLSSVVLPASVTSIGSSAFARCDLSSITIPENVTTIGSSAFEGNTKITSITFPKNITFIGNKALQNTGIYILNCLPDPENLTIEYGDIGLPNTTVIRVPSRFKSAHISKFGSSNFIFDDYIIDNGTCGTNLTWKLDGDGVLIISGTGDMDDYNNSNPWYSYTDSIKEVIIEGGVTGIGNFAFYMCEKMTSITIPSSVKRIGERAFLMCQNLKVIDIPGGVTSIGKQAFYYCSSVESISIPENASIDGEGMFINCFALKTVVLPGNLTEISDSMFQSCKSLTTVSIPDGVTSIGNKAFTGCSSLPSLILPSKVTSIGEDAFSGCSSLASVNIPNGVTSISAFTFKECTSLKSISIPDSVTSIGKSAFSGSGITEVSIPGKVTIIGEGAFYDCKSLVSVTLPNGLTEIDYCVFQNCEALTSIDIPNGVTLIAAQAFNQCRSLESVTMTNSVKEIGHNAFYGCTKLANLKLSGSLTSIGNDAFKSCESLTSVTIPGGLSDDLGQCAFANCTGLKNVTILDGVTHVSLDAFSNCTNITSLTIPSTVEFISDEAFENCGDINNIYCYANPENLNWDPSRTGFTDKTTLHVLSGYKDAYEALFAKYNMTVTVLGDAEGGIDIGSGVHLYGYSLSLDGNIGVNFYMTLDETVTDSDTAFMLFTVNGKTQKKMVSETGKSGEYYIFRCDTSAKEMCDKITAQVYLDDSTTIGREYSYMVRDYAKYILSHSDDYSAKTIDLVKAMMNYGAYSQIYFNYNTGNLANAILDAADKDVSSISATSLNPRSYTEDDFRVDTGNGFTSLTSVSLSLESETTLNLYFKAGGGNLTFICNGVELDSVETSKGLKVKIRNISAQNLGNTFTVEVYCNGVHSGSITYSPMNYCYNVLKDTSTAEKTVNLQNAVRALCLYNQAAIAYKQN